MLLLRCAFVVRGCFCCFGVLLRVAEDEMVVHIEVEQTGEAECEQIAPNHVPPEGDGEDLQENHLNHESPDTTAEIACIVPPEGRPVALGDAVAPHQEICDGEVGQRSADEGDRRCDNTFAGISVQPQVRTYPQHSRINGRANQSRGGKCPQTEEGMLRQFHSFFFGSGSILAK